MTTNKVSKTDYNYSGTTTFNLPRLGSSQSTNTISVNRYSRDLEDALFPAEYVGGNDSESVSFNISVLKPSDNTLYCELSDSDGENQITDVYHHLEGTIELRNCEGMGHFKSVIEAAHSGEVFLCGSLYKDSRWIQSTKICVDDESPFASPDDNCLGAESDLFKFMPNKPSFMCFEFTSTNETSWSAKEKLIAVDPQIRGAACLVIHLESGGLRLCYLVENAADIERYGMSFIARSWIAGLNRVEPLGFDDYVIKPMVKARAFSPDCVIYQAPSDGRFPKIPHIEYHAGGSLDTEKLIAPVCYETCGMAHGILEAMKPYPALYRRAVREDFVEQFMGSC